MIVQAQIQASTTTQIATMAATQTRSFLGGDTLCASGGAGGIGAGSGWSANGTVTAGAATTGLAEGMGVLRVRAFFSGSGVTCSRMISVSPGSTRRVA